MNREAVDRNRMFGGVLSISLAVMLAGCTGTGGENTNGNGGINDNDNGNGGTSDNANMNGEVDSNDNGNGDRQPLALSEVRLWGYQIQSVDQAGSVNALEASRYDMLVLEPTRTDWSSDTREFDGPGMVQRLKNSLASDGEHRKLIIAYIDIGEAEDWRWYWTWSTEWEPGSPFPDDWPEFILTLDPDGWAGNYPVAYWEDDWHNIILYAAGLSSAPYGDYNSVVDEVIRSGFDGVYLDWVEGFENEEVIAAAGKEGLDPAQEMIWFIEDIGAYARQRNPDFLIIQQNAAALLSGHPELTQAIDAIAQEGIWFDGLAGDDWNDTAGYFRNDADLSAEYSGWLDQYAVAGVPVFSCEYALAKDAQQAYQLANDKGYVPYVTRRSLSRLTDTLPPGYPE